MNKLEENRKKIDEIDTSIATLYEQRMDAVKEVLQYKKENNLPILDTKREKDVIEKAKARIKNPEYVAPYEDFVKNMMKNSRDYQQSLLATDVVAYAGIKGSFAQLTTHHLFPGAPTKHFERFEDVFDAVVNHKVQYGVLPFENTNSGMVAEVLDGLFKYPVYIRSMSDQKINQCLLGVKGATLKDIETVYSKDEALAQSRQFLRQLHVETVAYPNTAVAAQYVANEKDITKAAIGAKENAELYGLEVLAENVMANASNTTRFIVVGSEPVEKGSRFSILFTTSHTSGALAKVLEIIAKYELNMDNIQSRPRKDVPFEYFFFIEMDEDINKKEVQDCLNDVRDVCDLFKVIGCYDLEKEENA